jgi:ribosomal protein L31
MSDLVIARVDSSATTAHMRSALVVFTAVSIATLACTTTTAEDLAEEDLKVKSEEHWFYTGPMPQLTNTDVAAFPRAPIFQTCRM